MSGPAAPALSILPIIVLALKGSTLAVLQVAMVVISGYIVARLGYLDKSFQKNLNILNANLFTPALILIKIAPTLSLEKLKNLILIPGAFVVFTAVSTAVGWVTGLIFRVPEGSNRIVMACAMAVNSNSLPIALISSLSTNIAVLKMSPDDTPDSMLARGISYLVLFSTLGLIWRWSFMVPFLAKANAGVADGKDSPKHERRFSFQLDPLPARPPLWSRLLKGFLATMTAPLWAALLAIFIAIIPPVQAAFIKATPLTGAIDSVAGVSIPITLIVLGAYFYEPKPSAEAIKEAQKQPNMTRTIWASVLSRMVFSPVPLYALVSALTLGTLVVIFDDPIFVLSLFLLAGGPTALTIAQLTTAASPQFEKTISRVIFLNYVVFLLPMTVLGTVISIIVSTTFDVDDAVELARQAGNHTRLM